MSGPGSPRREGPPQKRKRELDAALRLLVPLIPFDEAETIREAAGKPAMKTLPASTAVWLATVSHIRHRHSAYDALLEEGYSREAARFFVLDEINAVLTRWRTSRLLKADIEES
jgi:hypothetical protein